MAEVVSSLVQVHIIRPSAQGSYEHLVLRRASDDDVFPGLWQCVTGRVHENERATEAALRECLEETGLKPDRFFILPYISHFYSQRRDLIENVPVFGVLCHASAKTILSHEHDAFLWLGLEQACATLVIPAQKVGQELLHTIVTHHLNSPDFLSVYELSLDK